MRAGFGRFTIVVTLFALAGCGSASIGPVTGIVTFQDKPVSEASITFNPIGDGTKPNNEPGKGATGFTDEKGVYHLSTYRPYDGALIGKHQVFVILDETNKARCKRKTEITLEVKPGSNQLNITLEK